MAIFLMNLMDCSVSGTLQNDRLRRAPKVAEGVFKCWIVRLSYFPVLFLSNGVSIRRLALHKRLIKNPRVAPGAEVSCWFHVAPLTPPPAEALSQSRIRLSSARHTHTHTLRFHLSFLSAGRNKSRADKQCWVSTQQLIRHVTPKCSVTEF